MTKIRKNAKNSKKSEKSQIFEKVGIVKNRQITLSGLEPKENRVRYDLKKPPKNFQPFLSKKSAFLKKSWDPLPPVSGPDLHEFVHRSKNNVLLGPKFHKYPVFESNTHQIPLETLSDNP